ncbi:hypothetical protein P7K49_035627 [Saguinus oedipus]|uniref:Uncharacterized protein n=1 Tax=Saguinus oedipus TaxID=9490 RepID=A0ABQ9TN47_SAGOE|nr:hypothetical protein P7K49_035627 [Saguinus oedipus]
MAYATRGNCRSGCFSFAAALRQRSLPTSCKTRLHLHPPPRARVGWEGARRVQRLGQAGGLQPAPHPYWLAVSVRPESGTRVPIHCLHPSSQPSPHPRPYLPPSPRLPPFLPGTVTLGAGKGRSRTRAGSAGGRRGRLELHNSTLVIVSEREAKRDRGKGRRGEERRGAERKGRERKSRETPADPEQQAVEGKEGVAGAVPERWQRHRRGGNSSPAVASAALPELGGSRLRARGSCVPATVAACALAEQNQGAGTLSFSPPFLTPTSSSQLEGCSGAARPDRAQRLPGSPEEAKARSGEASGWVLGFRTDTDPPSPPAAALSCCPKWRRKPWDWLDRMGNRARCRKTCKVRRRRAALGLQRLPHPRARPAGFSLKPRAGAGVARLGACGRGSQAPSSGAGIKVYGS